MINYKLFLPIAIVFLNCFSHKIISKVTLMTYKKNNPRAQQPLGKQLRIDFTPASMTNYYVYFSSCKTSMTYIYPVHSPLPWRTVVIFCDWLHLLQVGRSSLLNGLQRYHRPEISQLVQTHHLLQPLQRNVLRTIVHVDNFANFYISSDCLPFFPSIQCWN